MFNRKFAVLTLLAMPALFAGDLSTVEQAEKAWSTAVTKKDAALLEKVLADDLSYTHSTGAVDTKASYIGAMKSGKSNYVSVEYESMKPAVITKDVATMTCRAMVTTMTDGKPSPNKLQFLHVFRKKGNDWQLVSHLSARVPTN